MRGFCFVGGSYWGVLGLYEGIRVTDKEVAGLYGVCGIKGVGFRLEVFKVLESKLMTQN